MLSFQEVFDTLPDCQVPALGLLPLNCLLGVSLPVAFPWGFLWGSPYLRPQMKWVVYIVERGDSTDKDSPVGPPAGAFSVSFPSALHGFPCCLPAECVFFPHRFLIVVGVGGGLCHAFCPSVYCCLAEWGPDDWLRFH